MRWLIFSTLVLAIMFYAIYGAKQLPKHLVLGYAQEAPYAYLNEQQQLDGIFIRAGQEIIAEINVRELDWVLLEFFQLFTSLQEKRIDVIAAGITITPSRVATLCFAEPLLVARSGVLVIAEPATQVQQQRFEGTIAVVADSVEHQMLAQQGYPLYLVNSFQEGANAILQAKASGLAGTVPTLMQVAQQFKPMLKLIDSEQLINILHYSAFAFHPENSDWLKTWNQAQRTLAKRSAFKQIIEEKGFQLPRLADHIQGDCYES